MYKLLIADDDEIICRGIGKCIDWESHRIQVIGMVYDGEMALKEVREKRPDIVIVDINMPFMDGIEFSCVVRQEFSWIKIILLTAYKEFEYAQKAVQMQVFGYITKPFDNQEVLDVVEKALHSLEEEREYKEEITRNLQLIREKYLGELVLYGKVECSSAIKLVQNQKSYFQTAIFYLQHFYGEEENSVEDVVEQEVAFKIIAVQVREYVEKYGYLSCFFRGNRIILLYEYTENAQEKLELHLQEIMSFLGKNANTYVICGVGGKYQGSDKLPYSYREAEKVIDSRYEYGNQNIVCYKDVQKNNTEYFLQFRLLSDSIEKAIQDRDETQLRIQLDRLLENMGKMPKINKSSLALMIMEMLLLSYKAFEDESLYQKFFQSAHGLLAEILKTKSLDQIKRIVEKSFEIMFEYLKTSNTSENERLVQKALSYIKENYTNPEMNFKEVADSVGLSTSYLSALMKKYGNINYNQYLNEVRIERAKRFLSTPDIKTYEIAFYVGFNSSQYFSSIFKKTVGMTPKEYREAHVRA